MNVVGAGKSPGSASFKQAARDLLERCKPRIVAAGTGVAITEARVVGVAPVVGVGAVVGDVTGAAVGGAVLIVVVGKTGVELVDVAPFDVGAAACFDDELQPASATMHKSTEALAPRIAKVSTPLARVSINATSFETNQSFFDMRVATAR